MRREFLINFKWFNLYQPYVSPPKSSVFKPFDDRVTNGWSVGGEAPSLSEKLRDQPGVHLSVTSSRYLFLGINSQ